MTSVYMKILAPLAALTLLLAVACTGSEQPAAPATNGEPAASAQAQESSATGSASSMESGSMASQASSEEGSAASASTDPSPDQAAAVSVVTTSNILADWVQEVGQDRVDVLSLLPANADPHTYQPGAQDITQVAEADLVLSVGLELEAGWFEELVANAAGDQDRVFAIGDEVDPIDFVEIFEDHAEEEGLVGRLLIGDGETGAMSIIELDHGEVEQDAHDMGSRAGRIYATKSGRYGIAVSSDANTVHVIDSGLYLEAHDGHFDLVNREAGPVGLDLGGDRPVHLYVGEEWATVFYDGSGDVVLINEHELEEEGSAYQPTIMNAGAHHGAAIPMEGDLFAVTAQHPDYASNPEQYRLPSTVDIRNLAGDVLYSAGDCPSLHGDAGNGHLAVFGCVGGTLVVEAEDGQYDHSFISAPAGSPDDFRLTSVWGTPGADHFFALGSAVGLYVVEPEEGEMEQLIPAMEGNSPIQIALSRNGEFMVVVMSNGELRLYDTHDGEVIASNSDALTTPVETGFWARPHVAMEGESVFVTDSVGGQVLHLHMDDMEVVESWDVGGTPVKIAFVGVVGETGGHEEEGHDEHEGEEGQEEEEGHDHGHGEQDPHFWFDPMRVKQAVNGIAAHLSLVDPAGQTLYRDNAARYNEQLDELHAWIEAEVATVPVEQRLLVTSHDSFQYYAQRYGFQVVGAVIPSISTEVEPSAQDIVELIETIEHSGAKAVFAEKQQTDRLARQVADETGAQLIGGLYTGTLGPQGGEADNYLDFMRYNTTTIVEALR